MCLDAAIAPTPPHVRWAGQSQHHDGKPEPEAGEDPLDTFVDYNAPRTRPIPSATTATDKPSSNSRTMAGDRNFTLAATPAPVLEKLRGELPVRSSPPRKIGNDATESETVSLNDDITDTVGAIAIDCLGNIAAGSSSGGIGMKHKGRIGPAALVGVGTAVVPVDVEDTDKTCVATVTSGTGEHMATTMAASVCANRLYTGTRKGKHGGSESTDDDSAVKGFVERDFMGMARFQNTYVTTFSDEPQLIPVSKIAIRQVQLVC